ncbi:MAG: hypothetical protein IPG78_08960 [Ignavibacteria bacterium]|nr:hypothetical protein [Ignavibacteria bacterium]
MPVNTALAASLKIVMDTAVVFSQYVYVLVGSGNAAVSDNAEGSFTNWVTNQSWGITSAQSNSPTHSFTDSPGSEYLNSANNSMTLANALNLTSSTVVKLNFFINIQQKKIMIIVMLKFQKRLIQRGRKLNLIPELFAAGHQNLLTLLSTLPELLRSR